jgi:hypothetical protein
MLRLRLLTAQALSAVAGENHGFAADPEYLVFNLPFHGLGEGQVFDVVVSVDEFGGGVAVVYQW